MPRLFDEERRRWALQGDNVTYSMELDEKDRLRHVCVRGILPRTADEPVSVEALMRRSINMLLEDKLSSKLVEVTEQ